MAGNIKGITIELNADTKNFNKALKDIQSESKSLQTELKAVDRALKLDPKNLDLIKQKQDLLTRATSESKDALNALKSAKDKADKDMANGTEINQEQYRKLQREIAFAENNVRNLETETKEFTKTANKAGKEIDVFGDKTEKLNKAANTMGKVALGATVAIGGMAVKAAQSADDINTMSKVTGLSTEEIQKFQYASERIDVPIETLTGSMSKLTKNMSSAKDGTGAQAEAFKALGVNILDSNGNLRDNHEVFEESISKLGKMTNETERDATAMQLFGKSAQDLNPLILGGADALTQYGQEAEDAGLILSQESLDGANAFADGIDKLKATVAAGVGKMGGAFAEKLVPAIEKAVAIIEKIINFIANHQTLVITLVAILGTLALAIKAIIVVQTILNAVMLANPIVLIIVGIIALIAMFVLLWTKCDAFRNFFIGMWEGIKAVISAVGDFFAKLFTETIPNIFGGFIEFIKTAFSAIGGFFSSLWEGVKAIFATVGDFFKGVFSAITSAFSGIGDWFKGIFQGAWDGIKAIFSGVGSFFGGVWDTIKNTFTSIGSAIGDAIGGAFKTVINSILGFAENTINGFIKAINGAIGLINKIPGVSISKLSLFEIPMLAKGGEISNGQAIVAEAGPELISMINGKTVVTPLSNSSRNTAVGNGSISVSQLPELIAKMGYIKPQNVETHIDINGREFAVATAPFINKQLAFGR